MIKNDIVINKNILVGDLHFGRGNNSRELFNVSYNYFKHFLMPVITKFNEKFGNENVCITFMGDQGDNKQSVDTYIHNLMIDLFEELSIKNQVHMLVGNHDSPMKNDTSINSNKSFGLIDNVNVYTRPFIFKDVNNKLHAFVPHVPHYQDFKNIILDLKSAGVNYMYGHNSVAGFHYEGKEVEKENHISISDLNFLTHAWFGHIHKAQTKENITFVGSSYHTKGGEYKNDVGLTVIDFSKDKTYVIPNTYSPKFKKIHISNLLDLKVSEANKLVKNNYVAVLLSNTLSNCINTANISNTLSAYKNIEYVPITEEDKSDNNKSDDVCDTSIYEKQIDVKSSLSECVDKLGSIFINKQSILLTDKMKMNIKKSLNDLYELADKNVVEEVEI